MDIVRRQLEDAVVLELKGRLDCGVPDRELKSIMDDLAKRGCIRLVINLNGITHIDTTCLGLIIGAHVTFQRRGGGVRLVQTPRRLKHVLSIARLDRVLLTFETEEEAVRALERPATKNRFRKQDLVPAVTA
jgi:anti-anti-sigma factor